MVLPRSRPRRLLASITALPFLLACEAPPDPMPDLEDTLTAVVDQAAHEVAVYYRDLGSGDSAAVNADVRMHAASTMKVPVLIQLLRDDDAGLRSLDDTVVVTDRFTSIVDGSPYALDRESDSDSTLYLRVGEPIQVRELAELMITVSSNLATNLLVEVVEASRVTRTMRELGADSIEVLRGVEDIPAYEAGLSNTTTARDLGVILAALADGVVASPSASEEMIEILSRQQFRDMIPSGVPPGTRVANKDGWITRIRHDAAVVYPDGAPPYVLVVLTRGFDDPTTAETVAARISALVYQHHMSVGSEAPEP